MSPTPLASLPRPHRVLLTAAALLLLGVASSACSGTTDNKGGGEDTSETAGDTTTTQPDVSDDTGADVAEDADDDTLDTSSPDDGDTGMPGDTVSTDLGEPDCDPGFANCDDDATNGCEASVVDSPVHCGTCGNACPGGPQAAATCENGTCALACDAGFGDCDGDLLNGCEVDLATDLAHCSACDMTCPTQAASTPTCESGLCGVSCEADFGNCNLDDADGCEIDHLSSVVHCGGCDVLCPTQSNSTPTCEAGACGIECAVDFGSCDGDDTNGCEVDLRTTLQHCGACNNLCPAAANAVERCSASACGFLCNAGYFDVDGDPANGCEATFERAPALETGLSSSTVDLALSGFGSASYLTWTTPTALDWDNLDGTQAGTTFTTELASARVDSGRGLGASAFVVAHTPQDFLLTAPSGTSGHFVASEKKSYCTTGCGTTSLARVLEVDSGSAWNVVLANGSRLYWYRIGPDPFTGEICDTTELWAYDRCSMDSVALSGITALDLAHFQMSSGRYALAGVIQNGSVKFYRLATTTTTGTLTALTLSGPALGTTNEQLVFLPPGAVTGPGFVTARDYVIGLTTTTAVSFYRFTRDANNVPTGYVLESTITLDNYRLVASSALDAHNVALVLQSTVSNAETLHVVTSTPAGLSARTTVVGGLTNNIDDVEGDPRGGRVVVRDGGVLRIYSYANLP